MNLQAAALAYNLVVAIFPILVALFLIFGIVLGSLGPGVQRSFTSALASILPRGLGAGIVQQLLNRIQSSASALGIIVLATAIFGGLRLFILIPIMLLASSAPAILILFLTLFPFYAAHLLNGYGGQAGFAVILIYLLR